MKIVGLTGGIGSGKSTVAAMFEALGIPVYIADDEAKALMNSSKAIKKELIALLGESAYKNNRVNRPFIAQQVFNNKALLKKINTIVHPRVAEHFKSWLSKQNGPYVIKEAAIIFENDLEHQYDTIITVVAPKEERIKRVVARDDSSKEKVLAVIENQLPDDEKVKRSDFVIENVDLEDVKNQVLQIHNELIKKA
ncbi:dephospho-CoA kinase [uncultured Winogradskyella sp.]|uniref:dephospho-CoA kinase n=1 Tax=uncultured Winogradskyella sp. TaxID=395353 RepID=UPI00351926DD